MAITDKKIDKTYETSYQKGYESGYSMALKTANLALLFIEVEIGYLLDNLSIDKNGEIEKEIKNIIEKYRYSYK